jgi:site-specific DNA-methyltransferase (adenine-specific)
VGYAAPGTGNKDTYPHRIISTPFVGAPGTISSETYLCIGPFDSKKEAESVMSYICCRLTRFLILLRKPSQHVTRKVYTFVPTQKWNRTWTDADLYKKYKLTPKEIGFIEGIVRPMALNEDLFDEPILDDDADE